MRHLFPPKLRQLHYVYLAQFIIPACYLAFLPHLWQIALGAGLLLLFAVVYVVSTWVSYRGLMVCVFAEIGLMLLMAGVLHPGMLGTLFWPAAAIAGLKRRHRVAMLAVMIGSALVELQLLASAHHVSLIPYIPMILAGVFATLITTASVAWGIATMATKTALRQAELKIEHLTKVAERERISQDLHDVMGHELAMIALKSQVAQKLMERDPSRAAAELQDISHSAKQALSRVRAYIAEVSAPQWQEEWAAAARLLTAAGVEHNMAAAPEPGVSPVAMQALAMCLREAVTNIVKHSLASHAWVQTGQSVNEVWVTIADDGLGFAMPPRQPTDGTHGLSGIRARLAAVNGEIAVQSNGIWLTEPPVAWADPKQTRRGTLLWMSVPKEANPTKAGSLVMQEELR